MRLQLCGLSLGLLLTALLVACARDFPRAAGSTQSSSMVCLPQPGEVCGDGIDDNCNGLVDEGCRSELTRPGFVAAWRAPGAAVEALLFEPSGELAAAAGDPEAPFEWVTSSSSLAQGGYQAFLLRAGDSIEATPGRYRLRIVLRRMSNLPGPVRVFVTARLGSQAHHEQVELVALEQTRELELRF